jgi:hypothetical protein
MTPLNVRLEVNHDGDGMAVSGTAQSGRIYRLYHSAQAAGRGSPLFPVAAIKLLRFMWLVPILIFGYSLSLVATISLIEWGCLAIAVIGNILMIKGKLDLGRCHTWAGYYLPGVSAIRTGIFRWLPTLCIPASFWSFSRAA